MKKISKIILIGGSPVAGKSTVAQKLSVDLKIPWISTDVIRRMMRGIVRKEDYPITFRFEKPNFTAEEYLSSHTPKRIVANQRKSNIEVWQGAKSLVDALLYWEYSQVIEGIAICPKFINQAYKNNKVIKPIFLVDEDVKRIRKKILERGLFADAKKYSDDVKEIEVQWVLEYNKWLIKEVKKYKMPLIKIKDYKILTKEIKKFV